MRKRETDRTQIQGVLLTHRSVVKQTAWTKIRPGTARFLLEKGPVCGTGLGSQGCFAPVLWEKL